MPPEAAPAEPAPWPPKDWVVRHEVSTATNWWEVGKTFTSDPWRIIFFNFQTYDWRVVNWYMRERLNCNLPSPDGQSYRFGRVGEPKFKTYVYIPSNDWKAPSREDEIARDVVRAALHRYTAKRINFLLYLHTIRSTGIAAIEMLVGQRIIEARYKPGIARSAYFRPKQGGFAEFTIGSLTASFIQQSHIVREAIYAHLVLRTETSGLSKVQAQVICLAGQLLFLYRFGQPKPVYLSFARQAAVDVAWKMVMDMSAKGMSNPDDLDALETLIKAQPFFD